MSNEPHPPATSSLQSEDDRLRITEWRFQPGEATGYHRHEFDYVVVPILGGRLAMTGPDGEHEAVLVAGQSYARPAGVEHDVLNVDDHEVSFVEIEMK